MTATWVEGEGQSGKNCHPGPRARGTVRGTNCPQPAAKLMRPGPALPQRARTSVLGGQPLGFWRLHPGLCLDKGITLPPPAECLNQHCLLELSAATDTDHLRTDHSLPLPTRD